jgi:hypothetical protein
MVSHGYLPEQRVGCDTSRFYLRGRGSALSGLEALPQPSAALGSEARTVVAGLEYFALAKNGFPLPRSVHYIRVDALWNLSIRRSPPVPQSLPKLL